MDNKILERFLQEYEAILNTTLSRREFLKTQSRAGVLLAAGASGLLLPSSLKAQGMPDIGIARGDPGPAARAAVDLLGGMRSFVRPGQKVVIKPNMSFTGGVEEATNTHPEIVRELVAMCREAGASRVRVLDNPLRPSELCIEGFKDACRIFNDDSVVHALKDKDFFREVSIPEGETLRETDVMRDVLESDVLISAPVAKSHGSTGVSMSMKGMMGLILNRSVMHWRHDLHTAIVDLCTILKPSLVVIDGTRVLSTHGPGGPGTVLIEKTVIASRDMVAADAQAVSMFQWYGQKMAPRQVKHIRIAHERGLGRMDIENLVRKNVEV
ncbi:MAG: DUF362 domain-containing protein [Desulfomonilia bacterium]